MLKSLLSLIAAATIVLPAFPANAAPCFRGINLSGAEFGKPGGLINKDYTYPSLKTFRYFASKGFNSIRLPVMWERLQPTLMGPLDVAETNRLKETVALARSYKLDVVLDPHNYARYNGAIIGSADVPVAAFADFWAKLAALYPNRPDVHFGLMNEPYDVNTAEWLTAANAAIAAIRGQAKADNLVLVPGNAWTGAHSWQNDLPGGSNATVMKGVVDPASNYAYEVHQYFDDDFSGTKGNCSRSDDAVAAIAKFGEWLRQNKAKGYLGEFGVPADPACVDGLARAVDAVEANRDVWLGWSYWVGGDWWPESEPLNIQPTPSGDRIQLSGLAPALSRRACPG